MKLTTKGRFAVTAMLDVALWATKTPVTLASISERQYISLSYLEQLFGKLRRNGLVDSVRGPGGGYILAHNPIDITVAQIISAVDESMESRQCDGRENCLGGQRCMTHDLWNNLNHKIYDYLSSVNLQSLVTDHQKAQQNQNNIKQIHPLK